MQVRKKPSLSRIVFAVSRLRRSSSEPDRCDVGAQLAADLLGRLGLGDDHGPVGEAGHQAGDQADRQRDRRDPVLQQLALDALALGHPARRGTAPPRRSGRGCRRSRPAAPTIRLGSLITAGGSSAMHDGVEQREQHERRPLQRRPAGASAVGRARNAPPSSRGERRCLKEPPCRVPWVHTYPRARWRSQRGRLKLEAPAGDPGSGLEGRRDGDDDRETRGARPAAERGPRGLR